MARRGTRVMGLVAAFNGKTTPSESDADPHDIDAQFEAVLVRICMTTLESSLTPIGSKKYP